MQTTKRLLPHSERRQHRNDAEKEAPPKRRHLVFLVFLRNFREDLSFCRKHRRKSCGGTTSTSVGETNEPARRRPSSSAGNEFLVISLCRLLFFSILRVAAFGIVTLLRESSHSRAIVSVLSNDDTPATLLVLCAASSDADTFLGNRLRKVRGPSERFAGLGGSLTRAFPIGRPKPRARPAGLPFGFAR